MPQLTDTQLSRGGVFADRQEMPAIAVLEFKTEYKPGLDGQMVGDDWVKWAKKGENGQTTWEKIARLEPRNGRSAVEWLVVGPAYAAWKAGNEEPLTGTPLDAWGVAPKALVEFLKPLKIKTIEDFADLADHKLSGIPFPGMREMKLKAKAFKEARETASIADTLAGRDRTIEHMQGRLDEMAEMMKQLQAKLPAEEAPRRGPGRPRKVDDEADAA